MWLSGDRDPEAAFAEYLADPTPENADHVQELISWLITDLAITRKQVDKSQLSALSALLRQISTLEWQVNDRRVCAHELYLRLGDNERRRIENDELWEWKWLLEEPPEQLSLAAVLERPGVRGLIAIAVVRGLHERDEACDLARRLARGEGVDLASCGWLQETAERD